MWMCHARIQNLACGYCPQRNHTSTFLSFLRTFGCVYLYCKNDLNLLGGDERCQLSKRITNAVQSALFWHKNYESWRTFFCSCIIAFSFSLFLYEFQARARNVSIMKLIKVNWVFSSRVNPGCSVRLKGSNKTLQSVLRFFNYSQNAFIKTGAAAARGPENVLPFAWNSRKWRHYFVFSFFFHLSPNPSVPQGSHRPHLLETRERTLLYAGVSRWA